MSLATQIESVATKLQKYQAKIALLRDEGRYTRDSSKVEHSIGRIFKVQRKARRLVKKLPAMERRLEIARAYAEVQRAGDAAIKGMLDFRGELLLANVSATLPAAGGSA